MTVGGDLTAGGDLTVGGPLTAGRPVTVVSPRPSRGPARPRPASHGMDIRPWPDAVERRWRPPAAICIVVPIDLDPMETAAMHRSAVVASLLDRLLASPGSQSRPDRAHAHRTASLRPAPDARPFTGLRKARRAARPEDAPRRPTVSSRAAA